MKTKEELIQEHYDHGWIDYKKKQPTKHGYYATLYEHKDGAQRWKSLMFGLEAHWDTHASMFDTPQFSYRDFVIEVIMYYPEQFDYYVPCQMNLRQYPPGTKGLKVPQTTQYNGD